MIRVVTLLTDFGLADPYVAEMKGRLYAEWRRFPAPPPPPALVDLSHEIPPGDVAAGAWLLARAASSFGPGTVHLAVVDPGVGGDRPAVAAAAGGQVFVGPGNGLFGFLAAVEGAAVVRLDNPLYHRGPGGRPAPTFHGRDVFAPVAAHLAWGVPLAQVGTPVGVAALGRLDDRPLAEAVAPATACRLLGRVVWIDRFGNAITDIARNGPHGAALAAGASVVVGATPVVGPVATFAAGSADRPFWYWGSGETLEVALRGRSAAACHGWRIGLAVQAVAP